jgi:signal transduction histidine kinase
VPWRGGRRARPLPGIGRQRDLHDGAQQRLLSLGLWLRAAQAAMPAEYGAQLDRAVAEATGALDELREYARGLHPAILSERGLGFALEALANRPGSTR